MATNSALCPIVGHADGHVSVGSYSQNAAKYAGYAGGSSYYAYVLKFTTPDFLGVSESLAFSLLLNQGMGTDVTLRYALCTSDANKNDYCGTKTAVSDSYQITTGTTKLNDMSSTVVRHTVNVSTAKLKPETTYYLILWAYSDTGVSLKEVSSAWGDFKVTLAYNSGLGYIDSGAAAAGYLAYIDNGTSFDVFIPEEDNGSAWDILS